MTPSFGGARAAHTRGAALASVHPVTRSSLPLALFVMTPGAWATAGSPETVNGLYPLWEHTGVVHPAGRYQIGYAHAQLGLGRVQVATQPFLDLYGTWNAQAKVALWRGDRIRAAFVSGAYRLPTAAEDRLIGKLHAPGFSNPYAPVWLFPIALAKSVSVSSRIALHWSSTLLISHGELAADRHSSAGQVFFAEARAGKAWAARLHAGIEGLGVQGQGHVGVSFAYRGETVYLEAGAARRATFEGEQSNLVMFDAGLVFR